MAEILKNDWKEALEGEFEKPYYKDLRQFLIGDRPGQDNRIGEQGAPACLQHTVPFSQIPQPVAEMVHGIHAHDRIEGFILKRKTLIDIDRLEFCVGDPFLKCLLIGSLYSLFVDIHACDPAFEFVRQIQCRPT